MMAIQARTLKSDALLIITAIIWGFAFVAQRVGMDFVGPFTFNGVRFALGSISLIPLLLLARKKAKPMSDIRQSATIGTTLGGGLITGFALFMGASLQQAGLVYTTAGKAGFITGMYVIIVPILGLFWKLYPGAGTWIGAFIATIGLYLLSVTEQFTISPGDLLVLLGAFFWAGHVLIIGWLSPRIDNIMLAMLQFTVCSILSLAAAAAIETISMTGILQAGIPILYGGLGSVGVAYTLQVVAQKDAPPSHAAIILSTEAVFAAIGGWIILGEILSTRGLIGCALMLAGMLMSQLHSFIFKKKTINLKSKVV